MRNELLLAEQWMQSGAEVAIATVVRTWRSSPCPVGSQMVVGATGNSSGSVSGGCVETAVTLEAHDVIASGEPIMLKLSVSDQTARDAGLFCGGDIQIYLERVG